MLLGNGGTIAAVGFSKYDTVVFKWQDTGAVLPRFTSFTVSQLGAAQILIRGAQSDPATGQVDTTNTTAWINAGGSLTGLNGYRFFQIKIVLQKYTGALPAVYSISLDYEYDVL